MRNWFYILIMLFVVGCYHSSGSNGNETDSSPDTGVVDGDAYEDGDSDSDGDTDSDADSDSGGDSEECVLDVQSYLECRGQDVVSFDSCGNELGVTDTCDGALQRCVEGACTCNEGWYGTDCSECRFFVNNALPSYDGHNGATWASAFETVQEGVDAAALQGCNVWIAEGTYYPTVGEGRYATITLKGAIGVYGGFAGSESTLEERDIETHPTILDGEIGTASSDDDNSYHVLTCTAEAGCTNEVILDGLTVQHGHATGDGTDSWDHTYYGGGLLLNDATAISTNCVYKQNRARWGGGISVTDSSITLTGSTLLENDIYLDTLNGSEGGGLYSINSTVVILDSNLIQNYAREGAGVFLEASTTHIERTSFTENTSQNGGSGTYAKESTLTQLQNNFSRNTAATGGAGFYLDSIGTILNSTFSDNFATYFSGGLHVMNDSDVKVIQSLFYDNKSETGGAIDCQAADIQLLNSTFWNNASDEAGEAVRASSDCYLTVHNTIMATQYPMLNGSQMIYYDLWVGDVDIRYSNIQQPSSSSSPYEGEGNLMGDPLFVDPENGDFHLQEGSPCIGAGSVELLPEDVFDLDEDGDTDEGLPLDFDESNRNQGTNIEIGALEE